MRNEIQKKYKELLQKIAGLAQKQNEAYGDQIRCGKGCFSCCIPPESLFQVEAQRVEKAVQHLPPE
ncbi:MAG: hypothetical protein AAGJ35_15155, partial [Myxococcota bacterium]